MHIHGEDQQILSSSTVNLPTAVILPYKMTAASAATASAKWLTPGLDWSPSQGEQTGDDDAGDDEQGFPDKDCVEGRVARAAGMCTYGDAHEAGKHEERNGKTSGAMRGTGGEEGRRRGEHLDARVWPTGDGMMLDH